MVILGLGSNIDNRLDYLRQAVASLQQLPNLTITKYSSIYESQALPTEGTPEAWHQPYLNAAVYCETHLRPEELLDELKRIEKNIGKVKLGHWGPRVIDIDILAWDQLVIKTDKLHIPHNGLTERPFALWPLADVAPHWIYPDTGSHQGKTANEIAKNWGSRFNKQAPLGTHQIKQQLIGSRLVGVLNITPKSFSGDGIHDRHEEALTKLIKLIQDGAEIIDIGAESTSQGMWNTGESETAAETEWQRLEPILRELPDITKSLTIKPCISIDTRNTSTAEKALAFGIDWINDVTGFSNPKMQQLMATSLNTKLVMMHHISMPPSKDKHIPYQKNPVDFILSWAQKRLTELEPLGIDPKRIILDPGIGFGTTPEQSIEIISSIDRLKSLGLEVLLGHSRKSFLSLFTDLPAAERDPLTLAVSQKLIEQSVDYLRVHNVKAHAELLNFHRNFQQTSACSKTPTKKHL